MPNNYTTSYIEEEYILTVSIYALRDIKESDILTDNNYVLQDVDQGAQKMKGFSPS